MISKLVNIFKVPELRKKIGFTLALLFVFRLGGIVLVPGLDGDAIKAFMELSKNNLFGLYIYLQEVFSLNFLFLLLVLCRIYQLQLLYSY